MPRWLTRLLIFYGLKDAPKHHEGFVWHRYPDPPVVPAHPPLVSARERAQKRLRFRRVELLPDDSWLTADAHTGPFDQRIFERDTDTVKVPAAVNRQLHPKRETG